MNNLPDFFLAGCQKTASTWIYRCLKEHPDVFVPEDTDTTHYFDMFYHLGLDWYAEFYEDYNGEKAVGDTTPSYIRDNKAPKRIFEFNKEAKIIFTFRNPIDRAFSHYWHEKKKQKINFDFEECLENYDLYQDWIETGFYYRHLQRYLDYFPRDNIKIMIFDDLKADSYGFIKEIYDFIGVNDEFVPSFLNEKVNEAGHVRDIKQKIYSDLIGLVSRTSKTLGMKELINKLKKSRFRDELESLLLNKNEYEQGMNLETREQLKKVFAPENKKLEEFLGRELNWE